MSETAPEVMPMAEATAIAPQSQPSRVYRPPTSIPETPLVPLIPSPSYTPAAPSETPPPTATQVCTNNLRFLEDLTIPDGAIVDAGAQIDKRWLVENTGDCNWIETYRLRLIAGPSLGATTEQALYPARGGAQAVIQILFTAPTQPGTYRSAWQAHSPLGEPFGDIFYLEILVQ